MKIPETSLLPLLRSLPRDGYAVHLFDGMMSLVFGAEEIVCWFPASETLPVDRCIQILEAIQYHRRYRRIAAHSLAKIMTSSRTKED